MKAFSILLLTVLLLSYAEGHGERFRRVKRGAYKEKGSEELKYREESGWQAFRQEAKKTVKGDWLKKEIILVKFWKMANFEPTLGVTQLALATKWWNDREPLSDSTLKKIKKKLGVSMDQRDKDGRTLLFKQMAKNDMSDYSADPKERPKWEETFRLVWKEASESAIKRWEDGESEYATFTMLYNYAGWSNANGGCITCVDFTRTLGQNFDSYFPRMTYKVFMVNTGFEFDAFFRLVRLVLSKETNEKINVYGRDRKEWMKDVGKVIDKKVLNELIPDEDEDR